MTETVHVCGTGGFAGPLPGDPSNPLGLSAVGRYGYVEIAWQLPNLNPGAVSYTAVYRSLTADFATATLLVSTGGNRYPDPFPEPLPQLHYYWVQTLSIHGTPGDVIGPVSATALPAIEQILEQLASKIDSGLLATSLQTEISRIAGLDLQLAQEVLNRLQENQALANALALVHTDVAEAKTLIQNEVSARTSGQNALVTSLDTLATGVGNNASAILAEKTARTSAVDALAQTVNTLNTQVGQNTSAIQQEATARADAISASATELRALIANVSTNGQSAVIQDETNARIAGDASLANRITSLESKTGSDLAAAIQTVNQTHTDYVTAQAQTNTTLSATAADKGKVLYSSTAPAAADCLAQNLWIDTTSGANTPKRWNGSAWVAVTDKVASDALAKANTVGANLSTEQTVRADADAALAQQILTAQTSLENNISQVQQTLQTNINTVDGKVINIGALYTVKLNANGLVGGFGVYNDGSSVEAGFDVDTFWVGKTSGNKRKPFIIKDGVVVIDSAVIDKISANQIDSRGLTLRDVYGNIILGSGTQLPVGYAAPGTLNSEVVQSSNLIRTADFETGLGYWGAGASVPGSFSPYGKAELKVVARDTVEQVPTKIPVVANQRIYCGAVMNTLNTPWSCRIGAVFYDKNGNILAWDGVPVGAGVAASWVRGSITVPQNATHCLPWIQINEFSNFGYVLVSSPYLSFTEPGATNGAQAGLNLVDASGNPLVDSAIKNSAVSLGSNLVYNECFEQGTSGWSLMATYGIPANQVFTGVNLDPNWRLVPAGTVNTSVYWLRQPSTNINGNNANGYYIDIISTAIPVEAGKRYIVSAYTGALRAKVEIFAYFFQGNAIIGHSAGIGNTMNDEESPGGISLSGYKRIHSIADIPVNTQYMRVIFRKYDTKVGQVDSYMFVTQVQAELVGKDATLPGPWTPSGIANPTAVRDVNPISKANISTYIQGAAIDYAQIADAAIRNAHISDAAVTNAKIGNLSVDTLKISDEAVSSNYMIMRHGTNGENLQIPVYMAHPGVMSLIVVVTPNWLWSTGGNWKSHFDIGIGSPAKDTINIDGLLGLDAPPSNLTNFTSSVVEAGMTNVWVRYWLEGGLGGTLDSNGYITRIMVFRSYK